tara:strand:+ start:136 stop:360 length:225 start_codon:yes stop_codon:yes gene_type:complete
MSEDYSDELKPYLFEYRHEGAEWALEIHARNPDDAKARLKALPWSKFKGETMLKIKIAGTSSDGFWTRVLACFR